MYTSLAAAPIGFGCVEPLGFADSARALAFCLGCSVGSVAECARRFPVAFSEAFMIGALAAALGLFLLLLAASANRPQS